MFSMCSELTPRARIPDSRIPQFMQPWSMELFFQESKKNAGTLYDFYSPFHIPDV